MDNRQAIGYMLLACKALKLDSKTVKALRREMYWQFDMKTEQEADEIGHSYYYDLVDSEYRRDKNE